MYFGPSGISPNLGGTFAARPSASSLPDNTLYITSDGPVHFVVKSGVWKTLLPGGADGTDPTGLTGYTLVKSGSGANLTPTSTMTYNKGIITYFNEGLAAFSNAQFQRYWHTARPATTYTQTMAFVPGGNIGGSQCHVGFVQVDTANNRMQSYFVPLPTPASIGLTTCNYSLNADPPTTITFNANISSYPLGTGIQPGPSVMFGGLIWLQLEQTANDWIFRWGRDGKTWLGIQTTTRSGSYLATGGTSGGPNRVGLVCNPETGGTNNVIYSYSLV